MDNVNTYKIRSAIYQPYQEKLNIDYQGITINHHDDTLSSQSTNDEQPKESYFVKKLMLDFAPSIVRSI